MTYDTTRTATAGRFQTQGEDLVHYLDPSGEVVSGIDGDGTVFASDFVIPGVGSLSQFMARGGLPSDIDAGTF